MYKLAVAARVPQTTQSGYLTLLFCRARLRNVQTYLFCLLPANLATSDLNISRNNVIGDKLFS